MKDLQDPPFRLFDEMEDAMTRMGSLYLGPNWRGYYMVLACPGDGGVLRRAQFTALVEALRAKGYREGDDADDFDAAFQVATLRNWVGAPSDVIMVPHEQTEVLEFVAEQLADELSPVAIAETDAYQDARVAAARQNWEYLSPEERRRMTAEFYQGKRYTKWETAYAHDDYQDLLDRLLVDEE